MQTPLTPTLLLILDGWGQAPAGPGNAFTLGTTPTIDALLQAPAQSRLLCSGREVGLPTGFMGNSEVGHMNIGAGRVVYQDMTRIDIAIEDGSFATNPVVTAAIEAAQKNNGVLHLMGLLSDGGVHSHHAHVIAIIDAAKKAGVRVGLHLFMDGRDTGPTTGAAFLELISKQCSDTVRIASFVGRYLAMDRDKHWERTQVAWDLMVHGTGERTTDPIAVMNAQYAEGITDEFTKPHLVVGADGATWTINDGDSLFFFNFRADRARQLTRCFSDASFTEFDRKKIPALSYFGTMKEYDVTLPVPYAFAPQELTNTMGQVVAQHGLRQFRIAETEKYAHVTYFFNGGKEAPEQGEDQCLIPSPREISTYDQKPEMSAVAVTDALVNAIQSGKYTFIVCNFANMDMVGHTGNLAAAIKACESVDACVARIMPAMKAIGGRVLITADHGNVEEMLTPENTPCTTHSKNPVALILIEEGQQHSLKPTGKLADIAPTILALWGLPIPQEMTGNNLVE